MMGDAMDRPGDRIGPSTTKKARKKHTVLAMKEGTTAMDPGGRTVNQMRVTVARVMSLAGTNLRINVRARKKAVGGMDATAGMEATKRKNSLVATTAMVEVKRKSNPAVTTMVAVVRRKRSLAVIMAMVARRRNTLALNVYTAAKNHRRFMAVRIVAERRSLPAMGAPVTGMEAGRKKHLAMGVLVMDMVAGEKKSLQGTVGPTVATVVSRRRNRLATGATTEAARKNPPATLLAMGIAMRRLEPRDSTSTRKASMDMVVATTEMKRPKKKAVTAGLTTTKDTK
ncbi:hypothetical protein PTI98_000783 [Pleurotus ostreatus]|nr:hypothetical protein PTI98_000783 [Pleurotus ostreatus]